MFLSFSTYVDNDVLTFGVATLSVMIGFGGWLLILRSGKVRQWIARMIPKGREAIGLPLLMKLMGFFWLGVLPAFIMMGWLEIPTSRLGLGLPQPYQTLLWTTISGALLLPIIYLHARNTTQNSYPEIDVRVWTPRLLFLNALGWGGYLLGYEFLIRGVFLFSCTEIMGVWPAILTNTVVYALLHLPKNWKETFAALPFGLWVCWMTVLTQSVWAAFLVHWILSQLNSWWSLYFAPDKTVRWSIMLSSRHYTES